MTLTGGSAPLRSQQHRLTGGELAPDGTFSATSTGVDRTGPRVTSTVNQTVTGRLAGTEASGTWRADVELVDRASGELITECSTGALRWRAPDPQRLYYAGYTSQQAPVTIQLPPGRGRIARFRTLAKVSCSTATCSRRAGPSRTWRSSEAGSRVTSPGAARTAAAARTSRATHCVGDSRKIGHPGRCGTRRFRGTARSGSCTGASRRSCGGRRTSRRLALTPGGRVPVASAADPHETWASSAIVVAEAALDPELLGTVIEMAPIAEGAEPDEQARRADPQEARPL